MKIKQITEEKIIFDNGNFITYDHEPDCCEWNYADFEQLKDTVSMDIEFDEKLLFEAIDGYGFKFGNLGNMFFVPCYSYQNGYYSTDIQIYYGYDNKDGFLSIKEEVLYFNCEEKLD